jgi:putative ABC transport system permease protein
VNVVASSRTALRALLKNKLRSVLAMVGIIIAVAAVVAVVAIGQGAKQQVADSMASLGSNLLIVLPGSISSKGVATGSGATQNLTRADGESIAKEIPEVATVAPVNRSIGQVIYGDSNWNTTIQGTTAAFLEIKSWPMAQGDMFGREEDAAGAKVCVLGKTVADKLFGDDSPIGQQIRVKHVPCKVIGVLAAKGQGSWGQDQDDLVLMPWTTLVHRINGSLADTVQQLMVSARAPDQVNPAQLQIESLLKQRHHIAEEGEPDFSVRNLAEMQNAANAQASTISVLLAMVALISLVVGAIGIANVMLVSVTERTREIGIRMAVGGRGSDILIQFLTEAVMLAVCGGAVGIGLGVGVVITVAAQQGWPTLLSVQVMLGTLLLAGAAGVIAGFYPALRASRLDPIDALRFE